MRYTVFNCKTARDPPPILTFPPTVVSQSLRLGGNISNKSGKAIFVDWKAKFLRHINSRLDWKDFNFIFRPVLRWEIQPMTDSSLTQQSESWRRGEYERTAVWHDFLELLNVCSTVNTELLIQKWILDTIKNGWMISTLKYFVWLKKALSTDNQRSSPRRLSSNKMTNVNRFAIYLRFFHPRDLWSRGDQNLCPAPKDLELRAAATVNRSSCEHYPNNNESIEREISRCMVNILAPKIFTFLAEGARQAGERVSLQSISVQE